MTKRIYYEHKLYRGYITTPTYFQWRELTISTQVLFIKINSGLPQIYDGSRLIQMQSNLSGVERQALAMFQETQIGISSQRKELLLGMLPY